MKERYGILDFGDVSYSCVVFDLATAMAYAMMQDKAGWYCCMPTPRGSTDLEYDGVGTCGGLRISGLCRLTHLPLTGVKINIKINTEGGSRQYLCTNTRGRSHGYEHSW